MALYTARTAPIIALSLGLSLSWLCPSQLQGKELTAEQEEALELEWGSSEDDDNLAIESMSLEDLLADIPELGGLGSFGMDLKNSPYDVYLHAYTTIDWYKKRAQPNTFDTHYFNILVGAELGEYITPEIQLEYEHTNQIEVRYAQVDIKLRDNTYLRTGTFLVPFGVYNEFFYPEFLTKLPRGPLIHAYRYVIPVAWNDVGIQLFGHRDVRAQGSVNWNVYVTNGLLQEDDAETPEVEDGGDIRGMRGNFRDKLSGGKAVGGRLTFSPLPVFNVGVSAYSSAYTADDSQRITFLGAHTAVESPRFTFRTEGAYVLQNTLDGTITKFALYSRGAFRILDWLEPAVAVDASLSETDEDPILGLLGSLNFYPYQDQRANMVFRIAGGHYMGSETATESDIVMAQLTVGF